MRDKKPLVNVSVRVEMRMRTSTFNDAEIAAKRIINSCKLEDFEEITHIAPYSIERID